MFRDKYFARKVTIKTKQGPKEVFLNAHTSLRNVKMYGEGPYFELTVKETDSQDDSLYWAWKDYESKVFRYINSNRDMVEICFPYGTDSEERAGKGKLVRIAIEDAVIIE